MSNYKSYFLKSLGLTEDTLSGGKGDETTAQQVSPEELEMGIKVEMEHTQDPNLAKEIALDHLTEDPQYYSHLKSAGMADELPNGQQPQQGPMMMNKLVSPSPIQIMPIIGMAVRGSSTGGFPGGGVHDTSDKARYGGLEPVKNQKANSQGTTEHTDQLPPTNGSKLTPPNDAIVKGEAPNTSPKGNKDIHPHQVQQLGTPPPEDDGTGRSGKIDVQKKTDGPSSTDDNDNSKEPKHKKVWGIDLDAEEDDEDEEGEEVAIDIKEAKNKRVCFHCKQSRPCNCDKKDHEDQEASDPESPKFDWKRFGGSKPRVGDYKESVEESKEKKKWTPPWLKDKKDDDKDKEEVEESMIHKFKRLANIKEGRWTQGDYTPEQETALKTLARAGYREVSSFPDQPDAEGQGTTPQVIVVVQKKTSNFSNSQCEVDPQGLCNGQTVLDFLKQQVREGVGASEPFVTQWKMDKEKAGMVKKEAGALSEVDACHKRNTLRSMVDKMRSMGRTSPLREKAERYLAEMEGPSGWRAGFAPGNPSGMEIAAGGTEIPFIKDNKWYLHVVDPTTKQRYVYSFTDDQCMPEKEAYEQWGLKEISNDPLQVSNDPAQVSQEVGDVKTSQLDSLIQKKVTERKPGDTTETIARAVVADAESMGMKDASGKYDYIVSIVTMKWDEMK